MQGALRARLVGQTPAASRVYWLDRPQTTGLPAITLQIISRDRDQHMDGFQELQFARVQVDVWAVSYDTSQDVTEAAVAALAPPQTGNGIQFTRMFFESERNLTERSDAGALVHRTSFDALVHYQPAS